MDIYFSFVNNSKNTVYNQRVLKLEQALKSKFNILKSNNLDGKQDIFLIGKLIEDAFMVVCCLSTEYMTNNECLDELGCAVVRAKPILKIVTEDNLKIDRESFAYYDIKLEKLFKYSEVNGVINVMLSEGCAEAASKNKLDLVKLFVKNGADLNRKDMYNESTPLIYAAFRGNLEMVKYLHEKGGSLFHRDSTDRDAMYRAIESNSLDIVKYLFENGARLITPLNGETAIHIAVTNRNLEMVKCLVGFGAIVNAKNKQGETPLHLASGDLEIVTYLLENGANINEKNNSGWTPLHSAVSNGLLRVVKYLINAGANVTEKNNHDEAVVDLIINNDDIDLFKYLYYRKLIEPNQQYFYLNEALKRGAIDIIKHLYESGLDVHYKDINGHTALHKIAMHRQHWRHLQIAELLCEKGINMNEKDLNGKTALHLAFENNNFKLFRYLFTRQLVENSYSLFFFIYDIRDINYLKSIGKGRNKNLLEFINEILKWLKYHNFSKDDTLSISDVIFGTFDNKHVCKMDVNNPHLRMCKLELDCQHDICFKCSTDMIIPKEQIYCTICNEKVGILLDGISTIWSSNNCSVYDIYDIGLKSLNAIQKSTTTIKSIQDKTNEKSIEIFLNIMKYQEDSLDVRIQSLKMRLDILRVKTKQTVDSYLKYFKSKEKTVDIIEKLEAMGNIINFKKSKKSIYSANVGSIKLQHSFLNLKHKSLEKSYYEELLKNNNSVLQAYDPNKILDQSDSDDDTPFTGDTLYSGVEKTEIKELKWAEKFLQINNEDSYIKSGEVLLESIKEEESEISDNKSQSDDFGLRNAPNDNMDDRSTLSDSYIGMLYSKHKDAISKAKACITNSKSSVIHKQFQFLIDATNSRDYNEFIEHIDNHRLRNQKPTEFEINGFEIIKSGNIADFKLLFETNEIRVNMFINGTTFLFEAINNQRREFVEYLIEKGANLNQTDEYNRNALQRAAFQNSNDEIIDLLIERGCSFTSKELEVVLKEDTSYIRTARLDKTDNVGATILHYIAARGKCNLLKTINWPKDDTKDIAFRKDKLGFNCFERAALTGRSDTIVELNKIFNVLNSPKFNMSLITKTLLYSDNIQILESNILEMEISQNHIDLMIFDIGGLQSDVIIKKIEFLVSKGAHLNARDQENFNILMNLVATSSRTKVDERLLNYLVQNGIDLIDLNKYNQNIVHLAAIYGNFNILKLLNGRVALNERDIYEFTPLMYAVKHGHIDIVRWFINEIDTSKEILNDNKNIIELALCNSHENIYNMIKSCGLKHDPSYRLLSRKIINYERSEEELHFYFLEYFSQNNENTQKMNLQYFLIRCFKVCKLKTLLEHDIQIDKYIDNYGANVLHVSALFGRIDIILWLYIKGFNFKSVDKLGFTALAYAAANGHVDTITLLNILGLKNAYLEQKPILNYYLICNAKFKNFSVKFVQEFSNIIGLGLTNVVSLLTREEKEKYQKLIETVFQKFHDFANQPSKI